MFKTGKNKRQNGERRAGHGLRLAIAAKAGKLRAEGKDYVVQDGDVMHFRFNV